MQTIGQRIKKLREKNNLTQPQLADKIGVSKGLISFWENDKNEPKAGYIARLCNALNVSADYLLGIKNE